jgi:replicative DNA helicase
MSVYSQAKKYQANGWSVIPIEKNAKKPAVKWSKYQKEFAQDAEIKEWFDKDELNIGIVTGKLSNLGVVDADGADGLTQLQKLGLHSPFTVITGSGKQLYYKLGNLNNTIKKWDGLDTKGEGGYVVAPPSVHPNGKRYSWLGGQTPNLGTLPDWPTSKLTTNNANIPITPSNTSQSCSISGLLNGVSSGNRHKALIRMACYLLPRHNYDYTKHALLEWNKKNSPPIDEQEVVKQLNDVYGRFKKGQYKSSYQQPYEQLVLEVPSEAKEIESFNPREHLQQYVQRLSEPTGLGQVELPTGIAELDEATWGLKRGELYTVGARPGVGKSSLFVNIASNLCKVGKRVLFFSTEMSHEELFNKFIASGAEIPAFSFVTRTFTDEDKRKRDAYLPIFEKFSLDIINIYEPDAHAVRKSIEKFKPDVVIFDHIQHIAGGDNEYKELSRFTRALKSIAMEANVAVLVASQLHRGAVAEGVTPELHHLKGCGTIEEEAQVVILLHKETVEGEDVPIMVKVAKNRYGKCGITQLMFKTKYTKFESMGISLS